MSISSSVPLAGDIHAIRENYDTSNPVIAEILKAKEERLQIFNELFKKDEEDLDTTELLLKNEEKKEKKTTTKKIRKSEPTIPLGSVRRSTRLLNSPAVKYKEDEMPKSEPTKPNIVRPPNDYGAIPGVEIGTVWETRMECSLYGIHRPTVAGIHGGPDGAYSIALSGGYPEDVDEGEYFIYTGAGGRDLKGTSNKPKNLRTATQTRDQQLEGVNLSLVKSIESKLPVRVIRGYKSCSVFAPESGYRYDGLYQVVNYWEDVGKTGFRIYRYRMERIKDQPPPPWETNVKIHAKKRTTAVEEKFETNEESEFKENIAPEDLDDSSINNKDVKDVDNEIQMCIDFFCKAALSRPKDILKTDNIEEEFLGWE